MERLTADDLVMVLAGPNCGRRRSAVWLFSTAAACRTRRPLLDRGRTSGSGREIASRTPTSATLVQTPAEGWARRSGWMPRPSIWRSRTGLPVPAPGHEAQLLLAIEQLRVSPPRPVTAALGDVAPPRTSGESDRLIDQGPPRYGRRHRGIGHHRSTPRCHAGQHADRAPVWTPAPQPTARDLFADNLRQHAERLNHAFSILVQPRTTLRRVRSAWPALDELVSDRRGTVTSLDQVVGPDRNLALIRGSLDVIKQIAHAHDATVNDVLLAITAGGLGGLFRSREKPSRISCCRSTCPSRCVRANVMRHGEISLGRWSCHFRSEHPIPAAGCGRSQRRPPNGRRGATHPWAHCSAAESPGGLC